MRRLSIIGLHAMATAALLSAAVHPAAGNANTAQGIFAVEESGRMPCPAFVAARAAKNSSYDRAVGFIEGYLSAANRYEPNTFDLAPFQNSASFGMILDAHCKKQPSDTLGMATQRLVGALQPLRLAEPSKLIEVGEGQRKIILYEMILKRAQSALARKGMYSGTATGLFDQPTKLAFVSFQKSVSLDQTGLPDPATLWMLLNP
jgi:hypothetical protein